MPRPGLRPYECVRRAWHSDRHQPMRGSLIQEIFRVVNEIHSSAAKKNKEWQEKLLIVVLKLKEEEVLSLFFKEHQNPSLSAKLISNGVLMYLEDD